MVKCIDFINAAEKSGEPFFSLEYFPPKTEAGVQNLYERLERMKKLGPAFVDVTWGAGGTTAGLTAEITSVSQNFVGLETMQHMTCTNMPINSLKEALDKAKESGLQNILALRGDPPAGEENWTQAVGGFAHGTDLVKYIRQEYGDYFGICVAGYPEGHIDADSFEKDLEYLKAKVDAGADFIITQLFYDVPHFLEFIDKARAIGITVPIVPGIMPIMNYKSFRKMTGFCKTKIPQDLEDEIEKIKDDDEAIKAFGIRWGIKMCKELLDSGKVSGLHFYTLNLEKSVRAIVDGLGLIKEEATPKMPWRESKGPGRDKEEVRPIFWQNRPKSYIDRSMSWDEFPNGRWGDVNSPAFGDLSNYHLVDLHAGMDAEARRNIWGSPESLADIANVFIAYVQKKIDKLPWTDSGIAQETSQILSDLIRLNENKFFTINSQPRVHGIPSADKNYGWGAPNGYVYQKAYVEGFCSFETLQRIMSAAEATEGITFHAVNAKGEQYTNQKTQKANAVTWGVFPDSQIIQPTVVDPAAFMIWKDEAFRLWKTQWASIYPEDSKSAKLINDVHDNFWLVNLVDNDVVAGSLMRVFVSAFSDKALDPPASPKVGSKA